MLVLVDLAPLVSFLNTISSVAVILGAIFVVFQLRQNARLIQTTIRETKANASIALLEEITESFARRRKEIVIPSRSLPRSTGSGLMMP